MPQCPRHPQFLSPQAVFPLLSAPYAPKTSPGGTAVGQACSTPFQKADLRGAGTVAGRTVPLTFAPPQPALCAHDAHGLCVRGRGAGVVNQSLPTGATSCGSGAPTATPGAGRAPAARPPAGRGPDQGWAPARKDSPGKRGLGPPGLPPTAACTAGREFSLPGLLLMRSNCFPSFFYQNSGSRLGREPFSPKEAPRFEGLLRGGQPEPPAGRSAHRKLGARRGPLTWRPPGCGRAWEGGGGLTPRTCLSGEALVHCETPRSWQRTPSPASTRPTQRAGVGGDQLRGPRSEWPVPCDTLAA